jgi:hypothetical protein
MVFSLDSLKPKITDVEIEAYGDKIVIPIMPLTYTEYHSASIGIVPPDTNDYKKRELVKATGKIEDVLDRNDPDYLVAMNEYVKKVQMRRLAIALERGGVKEFEGVEFEEQIELVRGMDAGITSALIKFLEREANHKIAMRFQPVSGKDS